MKEKVAVIDGGGRGAVLVDRYLRSPHVGSVVAIPGNDMMKCCGKQVETFPSLKTTSVKEILEVCRDRKVTFVDVCQDNAIHVGLVDELKRAGIKVLGPTRAAGEIEWSKSFARQFGARHMFPQPHFAVFNSENEGIDYVNARSESPLFIKADFLCEGKGALPGDNRTEAIQAIQEMKKLKDGAGSTFLIEQWLKNADGTNGEEFSAIALSDGTRVSILGYAQDHKRRNVFDQGANTGGMGCSAPPLVLTGEIKSLTESLFAGTITGLKLEHRLYQGVLYLGAILIRDNQDKLQLKIVEWNSRWGDPEAQAILPGIKNDLFEISMQAASGNMGKLQIENDGKSRVVIAGVSKGYPGNYDAVRNKRIFGLEKAMRIENVEIYGAGVKISDGKYYANGGRLFYVVGEGANVIQAKANAVSAMSLVYVEGNNLDWRHDIGWRDVERLQALRRV